MNDQDTSGDQGTSGASGAPGAEGTPGGSGGRGGAGGAGGTGGIGKQGEPGEPGPPGTSHTAVVVQQTKLTKLQRTIMIVGGGALIVVTVLALVLSLWVIHTKTDQVRDKNAQVDALRKRSIASEALNVQNLNIRRNVLCVYLAKVDGFSAAISTLVLASPNLTPEQRAGLTPFATVTPLPKECTTP